MRQLNITFEPGLSQRSRSVREHLATRVYARGLVETAGKMDLSPSKLTEKLAGSDSGGKPRGLTIDELEAYLQRRSEEHTSELQSLMRISYAVFCLKKKTKITKQS